MKKAFLTAVTALMITLSVFSSPQKEMNPASQLLNSQIRGKLEAPAPVAAEPQISEILYSLSNLYSFLNQNFLYEIDMDELEENMVSALVDSLGDKYSYYVSEKDAQQYETNYEGEYVGIGTYLVKMNPAYAEPDKKETYMIIITSPFPGGPADRAGLRANDMISHINGEDISELDGTAASKKLRGKAGEELTITVHRGNSVFDITLKPEKVVVPTVVGGMLDDEIAYMNIIEFANTTSMKVEEKLTELMDMGMKALVLDLRNNPGGTVQPALDIADMLLGEGIIITVKYKEGSGNRNVSYGSGKSTLIPLDIPICVLINGGTASASEILTASLVENDRAFSIGDTSFGKGIMQSVIPYGKGFIQFTSANYYTPDGNSIHEKGITPDILIPEREFTDEEMEAYADFMEEDRVRPFREEHPEYTFENTELFAETYEDSGVPREILTSLITKEYIYSMDIEDRPLVDIYYDDVLKRAVEELEDRL